MKPYKARGIVLHTVKYGDSSVVAYMLTDVGGRRSYMVQGIKSTRGHGNKGALLQPMFVLELEGYEAPRAELHRIREMRADPPLRTIPFDVRKSTVALFMAEMLYRLVREVEANSPLFEFVEGAVLALDDMTDGSASGGASGVANFHLWFMVGLARHLGFFPGNEWALGRLFDIREGLFTPVMPAHGNVFSPENSALLGRLMAIEWRSSAHCASEQATPEPGMSLSALPLNRVRRVDFLNSMLAYFGYHLDAIRDIRSVDILREVF